MANKYKNIVGTAFAPYVKNQFDQRRKVHKKNPRTSKEILYLTNRNAFFRLSSAAETTGASAPTPITTAKIPATERAATYGPVDMTAAIDEANAEQLKRFNDSFTGVIAKDNVLQGGTVIAGEKNSTTLRKGFKQTYAEGTFDNLGLQPMPGITGITIGTGGKWQTLMQADIEFICYNLDQLDIMSKLYMSLGVTCFLEWGHIPYLDKSGNLVNNPTNLDFFGEKNKINLIKSIDKKRKETDGNYDAFLGTVYNFSYQADKDGAYLCKTQLMGAGGMVESLKINTSFNIDFAETNKDEDGNAVNFNSSLDNALFSMSELLRGKGGDNAIYKSKKKPSSSVATTNYFGKVGKDNLFKIITDKKKGTPEKGETRNEKWGKLLNDIYGASTYTPFQFKENGESGTVEYKNEEAKYGNAHQYVTGLDNTGLSEIDTDFYAGYANHYTDSSGFFSWAVGPEESVTTYITFGHLLALINSIGIFTESNTPEANKTNIFPVLYIDYHPDNTIINLAPITATINPYKALVPFVANTPYDCFFAPLNVNGDQMKWYQPPSDKGLKARNLSLSNVKNRINSILPSETFIYNKDNLKGGKLMNVLVNIDFVRDCLRTTKDSDNNTNLIEYVSKVLEGINESLGSVNNFRPFIDECGMILRIIDEKAPNFEAIKENLVEIPTFGLESSAYDASYQSAITPKLASQIVIATQASGGQGIKDFSEDVLSYQSLNAGVKDRFATYKYPAITKPPSSTNIAAAEARYTKSLLKLYNTMFGIYTANNDDIIITNSVVTNMLSPWIDLSNTKSKQTCIRDKSQKKNNSSVLIPLEYTITMDGIAGILPYNAFLIPNNRLPERYRGKVSFAVFSINHAFDNNNWTTTLRGQTLMLDTPKTIVDPKVTAADSKVTENPNNENPNQSSNYPKVNNTGTTTEDTPGLDDSPTGGDVTDNTPYNEGQTPVFPKDITPNSDDIRLTIPFTSQNENEITETYEPYKDITYKEGNLTTSMLRIGFGSETVTRRGQVRKVVRGDIITKKEAYDDLERLLSTVTKPFVVDKLSRAGVDYYKLDKKMQVVILDIAYNYGGDHKTLYNTFVSAIKKGKQALIDELIRRKNIGGGQIPSRREAEINYLRG